MRDIKRTGLKGRGISLAGTLGVLTVLIAAVLAAGQTRAATIDVTNFNDSGPGSLRQAMLDANAAFGPDLIRIQIGNSTINLVTPLPKITDTVAIINYSTGSGRIELNGIATRSGTRPSIGFDVAAPNCEIWGFAINRFGVAGIRVGVGGDGTVIHQNYVGTNAAGNSAMCPDAANPCGNLNRGIWVHGATGVQIGVGGFDGHPNTVSGNLGRGIAVSNAIVGSTVYQGSATIRNNYIGIVDGPGGVPMANTHDGIVIAGSSNNIIGGSASNDRNYIHGNGGNGILIVADKSDSVSSPASGNVIKGNYIGQTISTAVVPNKGSGIVIEGSNTTVGGTTAAERNVIIANKVNGIAINGSLAFANVVQGNYIGVGSGGTTAFGNAGNGIQISNFAYNNTIGGPGVSPGTCTGPCNLIANNGTATALTGRAGIYVDPTAARGNYISGNSIYGNLGLGIDLAAPGALANDAGDADGGPNASQNKPDITGVGLNGTIAGTLSSAPLTTYQIAFYRNTSTDGPATTQGRTFIGSVNTTTDGVGNAVFTYTTSVALALGEFVTATATVASSPAAPDTVGSTSELSTARVVTPGGPANAGLEGDVAPRPNGDNSVSATDVSQVRRFAVGLDTPDATSNEFQRADTAPYSSGGDGSIAATDVTQAQRYQIGLDQQQTASGPTTPSSRGSFLAGEASAYGKDAARTLRVVAGKTAGSKTVTVAVNVDASGNERNFGFSLTYDPKVLADPIVRIGSDAAGGNVLANTCNTKASTCSPGAIGFSIDFAGGTMPAGTDRQLVTVTFTIVGGSADGETAITFGGYPAFAETSDVNARALPTLYRNGTVKFVSSSRTK